MPILLDAIQFSETGHLSPDKARVAVSKKDAIGTMQFLRKNLHDMGYGMPRNISVEDVQDPTKARQLAGKYITGYTNHHQFRTPLEQMVAYNWGPDNAKNWISEGSDISKLPKETRDYISRAASFLQTAQTGNNEMTMNNDGYGLMRQLGYSEAQIADAKRRGVPAEYFDAVSGFNKTNASTQPALDMTTRNQPVTTNQVETPLPILSTRQNAVASQPSNNPTAILSRASNTPSGTVSDNSPSIISRIGNAVVGTANASDINTNQVQEPFVREPILDAGLQTVSAYSGPITGNRRDKSMMAMPSDKIGLNEAMIRIGGNILGASRDGGMAALNAGTNTFGDIQDYNRTMALEAYDRSLDASATNAADTNEAIMQVSKYDETLDNFEKASGFFGAGQPGLTGLVQGTIGSFWDRTVGDSDKAAKRLLLERLRVDDLLLRIAQTKGAISNKEMEIFAQPAPKMTDDDGLWERWIDQRIEAIRTVRNNLAAINQLPSRQGSSGGSVSPNAAAVPITDAQQDLLNKYK